MAYARGASGLSFVVGVDKPSGMTSHDVVNACRRIFSERRVGHTGTLDPLATGVLPICVGPATRLDQYLVGHDKTYEARIAFGASTDTFDAFGSIVETALIPPEVKEERVARACLASMVGFQMQIPPAHSAIKVEGKKAYEAARAGQEIELAPREITVYEAALSGISYDEETGYVNWDVTFSVSSGTYIRALARDLGVMLSCPAHIASLRRTSVGSLTIEECHTLESLEDRHEDVALDPVALLGFRVAFAKGEQKAKLVNGNPLDPSETELFALHEATYEERLDACSSLLASTEAPPCEGELISVVCDGSLKAIYAYDEARGRFNAKTIFSVGVSRG
ncbi:MAG: tRNA pseudouridine(55) synthase TruB [Eggerthellaceae bacterium]|nr:tRNA pseudouridine(55) synthase TruB [Eggerthellaceae bacterium]